MRLTLNAVNGEALIDVELEPPFELDFDSIQMVKSLQLTSVEPPHLTEVPPVEETPSEDGVPGDDGSGPIEIITLMELENVLGVLEGLNAALENNEATLPEALAASRDAAHWITVVLAMGYAGDVQAITLACLARLREIEAKAE